MTALRSLSNSPRGDDDCPHFSLLFDSASARQVRRAASRRAAGGRRGKRRRWIEVALSHRPQRAPGPLFPGEHDSSAFWNGLRSVFRRRLVLWLLSMPSRHVGRVALWMKQTWPGPPFRFCATECAARGGFASLFPFAAGSMGARATKIAQSPRQPEVVVRARRGSMPVPRGRGALPAQLFGRRRARWEARLSGAMPSLHPPSFRHASQSVLARQEEALRTGCAASSVLRSSARRSYSRGRAM